MDHMSELTRKMDASVLALRDAFIHEQQEALLLAMAESLLTKLADRERVIFDLRLQLDTARMQLQAFKLGEADE
jgi:hypothetical protein